MRLGLLACTVLLSGMRIRLALHAVRPHQPGQRDGLKCILGNWAVQDGHPNTVTASCWTAVAHCFPCTIGYGLHGPVIRMHLRLAICAVWPHQLGQQDSLRCILGNWAVSKGHPITVTESCWTAVAHCVACAIGYGLEGPVVSNAPQAGCSCCLAVPARTNRQPMMHPRQLDCSKGHSDTVTESCWTAASHCVPDTIGCAGLHKPVVCDGPQDGYSCCLIAPARTKRWPEMHPRQLDCFIRAAKHCHRELLDSCFTMHCVCHWVCWLAQPYC